MSQLYDNTIIGWSHDQQKYIFQTKHGNLDAANAYQQLNTSTRPVYLRTIDDRVYRLLANRAGQESVVHLRGTAGAVLFTQGFLLFCLKFIFFNNKYRS